MPDSHAPGVLAAGALGHLGHGDVGRYVFVPGDPARCALIACHLDDPVRVGRHREFELWNARLDGEPVSVCSTGIGGPSTAIAAEELADRGATTFVRVGTSGAVSPGPRPGDLAIVSGAVRDGGTALEYLPVEFPAVADLDIVAALRAGARERGRRFHVGLTQSKDSFYGEVEPARMPVAARLGERWRAWQLGGVVCSEMEASTLFAVAATRSLRAGGIMLVAGAEDADEDFDDDERHRQRLEVLIEVAITGLRHLIAHDLRQQGA